MRYRLAIILTVILASPAAARTRHQAPPQPLDLDQFLQTEIAGCEQRHDIKFPSSCHLAIRVGIPNSLKTIIKIPANGIYRYDSSLIMINTKLVDLKKNKRERLAIVKHELKSELVATVRHELGHAYPDWVSRELTGQMWPMITLTRAYDADLGLVILAEGMAETFCRPPSRSEFKAKMFPNRVDPKKLRTDMSAFYEITYEDGYTLVSSLVTTFGMGPTVAYIVTHPLVVDPKQLRQSVTAWYRQAEGDLSKK